MILGIDNSGKTTLLNKLKKMKKKWKYISANPEDLYPMKGLGFKDWKYKMNAREFVGNMLPFTRSAFYINTLAIEYEYYLLKWLNNSEIIVCDSYWYRFLAKERFFNPQGVKIFEQFTKYLRKPDIIIWLDIDYSIAYSRKLPGRFEVNKDISLQGYKEFQKLIMEDVAEMTDGIPTYRVNSEQDVIELADNVVNLLDCFIKNNN